jgi:hypothetical protein
MKKFLFSFIVLTQFSFAESMSKFNCQAAHLEMSFTSEKGLLNGESDLRIEAQGMLLTVVDFKTKFVSLNQNKLTLELEETREDEIHNPKLKALLELELASACTSDVIEQGKLTITQRSNIRRLLDQYALINCSGNLN